MAKTIGRFTYRIVAPGKGDRPFNAIVNLGPHHWSTEKDGWPCLTPNLMTEGEIDHYVSALKVDLDRVGRVAKKALTRANDRTLSRLRSPA